MNAWRPWGALLAGLVVATGARAQTTAALDEQHRAGYHTQATDPDMKREGGTQPRDWPYDLPDGVRTRVVTFYVDGGTALHGKLFLPKEFTTKKPSAKKWPAV